jgi:hypothetical protein
VKGDNHFEVNTNVCVTCHLLREDPDTPKGADGKPPTMIRLAVREDRAGIDPHATMLPPPKPDSHGKLPPDSCSTCHNPPAGTIERNGLRVTHAEYLSYGAKCESCHRGTTEVPAPVENGQCFECHNFGLEKNGDVEHMHKIHNEGPHKIECFSCHGTVHHGPTAQAAQLDRFDCNKCHTDQHGVQRRTYLHKEGPPPPDGTPAVSPMFLAHVDCTGCHIKERPVSVRPDSGATVKIAVPEACDACHKPGFGAEMIPLWQKTTHRLYDQVETELKAAESEIKSDEGKALLEEVRKLQQMVRVDGSWGVHNPRYTQQALEQARNKLAAARAAAKPESKP